MKIWHNGAIKTEEDARIAVTDRGLTLADGVFDTMLAVDGVTEHQAAHFARLTKHAAVLGITIPYGDFFTQIPMLLQENGFTTGRHAVRTTITRGPGIRGLMIPESPEVTVIMRASPVPDVAAECRLMVAHTVRRNEGSPLSRIKSLNYGDNILALREAVVAGADDAVMLNNAGFVACASASNIYVRVGADILTPPLPDGAMDGIVRAHLLESGFAREGRISAEQLYDSAEIYLSNSITGLRRAEMVAA